MNDREFYSDFDPYQRQPMSARGRPQRGMSYQTHQYPQEHEQGPRRGGFPPRQRQFDYGPQEEIYVARRGRAAYKFYKPGPRPEYVYDDKEAYQGKPNYRGYENRNQDRGMPERSGYDNRPVYAQRDPYAPQRPGYFAGTGRPMGLDQKREPAKGKMADDGPAQRKAKPASGARYQRRGAAPSGRL